MIITIRDPILFSNGNNKNSLYWLFFFLVAISVTGNCSDHFEIIGNRLNFLFEPSITESDIICTLRISVPEDRSILLKFETFAVPSTTDCIEASVQLYDGGNVTARKIGDKICGNTLKPDVESSGNNLIIQFMSNTVENIARFSLTYETTSKLGIVLKNKICMNDKIYINTQFCMLETKNRIDDK